ncbi:arylsulfatase [Penicillium cosmopolitanum]|uniref:Arylsulfatase n=1 Tax=Penicillium cosmopolitanum TaxID=1131564 RepID=A0A9W9VCW4_9EURO|nr:arylsulfatase [Penicillium cosmopolitanum]KAJ5376104.1 arylsulfatase [Penicillium cosmopolitanum]
MFTNKSNVNDRHRPPFDRSRPTFRNHKKFTGPSRCPRHEGYLTQNVVAIPELLKDEGSYKTFMAGKWHLGLKRELGPSARGFERSFALLPGCANHYGYEPQYENILNEPPRFFETAVNALHMEDGEYLTDLPKDFYSSDHYASKLLGFLSERDEEDRKKPFFAYLPFSAPHWPLQAPKASMDKYRGVYDDGPEVLRQRRLARLKELGMVGGDVVPHEVVTTDGELGEWEDLSGEERAKSARSMEAFAGMVDRMDENVGRVLEYLKSSGEYDDTVICFMSDNGAEGASYEAQPLVGESVVEHIRKYYDNSLENIGRANSFVWYGSRWAQAATAPSRLYKMFSTEGGCRVPLIVKPVKGGVEGGGWKPFLDAMAAEGSDTARDLSGTMAIHGEEKAFGWEIAGSGALRRGRYKITYVPLPRSPQRWELFDIIDDPGEVKDLSEAMPEVFNEMLRLWGVYAEEVGVVGLAGDWKNEHLIEGVKDEFEDTGRWIRFIGKKDVPAEIADKIPR